MIRPSACLRIRVVRWSRRNRSANAPGSRSAAPSNPACQLPVQQGLTAHGDVQEDLVDPLAQFGLVDGGRTAAACTVANDSAIRGTPGWCWCPGVGTPRPRPRRRPGGAVRPRAAVVVGHAPTLSFSPPRSLVTLRPNHTSRKTETTTATSPSPPARTASVTSRSAERGGYRCQGGLGLKAGPSIGGQYCQRPPARRLHSPAGCAPVLARIWLSMAWHPDGGELIARLRYPARRRGRHQGEGLVHEQVPVRHAAGEQGPGRSRSSGLVEQRTTHQRDLPGGHLRTRSPSPRRPEPRSSRQRGPPVLDRRMRSRRRGGR